MQLVGIIFTDFSKIEGQNAPHVRIVPHMRTAIVYTLGSS